MLAAGTFGGLANELLAVASHTAREIILTGEPPLDIETFDPRDLYPAQVSELLDALIIPRPIANFGGDPIAADHETHAAVARYLDQLSIEGVHLVGEEAPADAWKTAQACQPHETVIALDAVDGSKPYDDLTFGYGATLVALERVDEVRYVLRGVALCNSTGVFVAMEVEPGGELSVVCGWIDDDTEAVDSLAPLIPMDLGDFNDAIATVAARPEHRSIAARLMASDMLANRTVYNLGGSPAAIGLFRGRLGALVCLERQTMWDAAFLPIASALGLTILRLDTREPCDWAEVRSWYTSVSPDHRTAKAVPPVLVAREAEYARTLLEHFASYA